jgi:hypothetical protein
MGCCWEFWRCLVARWGRVGWGSKGAWHGGRRREGWLLYHYETRVICDMIVVWVFDVRRYKTILPVLCVILSKAGYAA